MITKRGFWDDCYVNEFEAVVTEISDDYVVIDKTYFYPQGGGQPGDTGYIGEIRVVDTKKDDNRIYHYFEEKTPFSVGDTVKCKIDWERRYNLMKAHSASHIVEYFIFDICGRDEIESTGSLLSENKDSSTFITEFAFTPEILKQIEDKANAFISEGNDIVLSTSADDENVRIWTCGDIVYQCGGTHPHNTEEIGRVTVKRKTGGKGKQKIITEIVI